MSRYTWSSMLFAAALLMMLASCQTSPTDPVSPSAEPLLSAGRVGIQPTALGKPESAGLPETAHVMFGNELAGSPFPPPSGHDRSFHGIDRIIPKTVVIAAGGTVHFEIHEFHQAAIYAPGTVPEDIVAHLQSGEATLEDLVTPMVTLEDFIINDPVNRLALSPFSTDEIEWTPPAGTFDTPGRYFMICTVVPHFFESKMYGWIEVK